MKRVSTLLGIFWICSLQAQTGSLKLRLEEGQTFTMQMEQNVETVQSAMGQEMKVTVQLQTTFNYKVLGQEEGQWVLEAQYQQFYLNSESPMGRESIGSELKDNLSLGVKATMNKPYTVLVTEGGKVTAVKGLDELFAGVEADLESMSRGNRRTVVERIKTTFSEEVSKSLLESCFVKDPERALRPGLVWMRRDTTASNGMDLHQDAQYRINAMDGQAISLSITGNLSTDPNAKPIVANGMETKTQLYGSMNGNYSIDSQTGWVTELEVFNDLSGNATVRMGGNSMDVPLNVVIKAKLKRL